MVSLASSIEMEDYAMVRSTTWFYMETEDVYGSEEQSDLEKAIEADAVQLETELEDGDVETQQSATSEHLDSDDEGIEDAFEEFGEENDRQPNSGSGSKEASEAGTTCGSTDETDMLPYIGMKFVDLEAAYSFYNNYARMSGFGVRIDRTQLSRKRESDGSRQVLSKRFVCYKEGFRYDNDKRQKGKEVHHRAEVRIGCPAFLQVKAASDGWVVDRFEASHNHPMVLPGQLLKLQYFGKENDQQPNSGSPKDASEVGTTCGSNDETEMVPYIGMKFVDLKAAYSFYNSYARMRGFGVRIDRTHLSRKKESDGSRQVLSKKFVCYKEGFRNDNHKRQKGKEVRHRAEVRVGCLAFLLVKATSNGWVVDKFEENHNHPMVFPGQTFRLRSHQNLTGKSYIRRNEREMIPVDCQAVLAYFDSMQVKDPGFIYSINVSDDGMVSGIFWADSKARSAYEVFGDVVVFDTTYKTNRYGWLFGPFTGVNHHAQPILFGCGLVANETKESFEWLFKVWMNAMGDKAPKAIITNECTGVIPAVGSIFPKTVHRLCSWHIAKHAIEHLGTLWNQNPYFKNEWKQCIYHSLTEKDFLGRWDAMIVKYNLKDHSWLIDKFTQKQHWVPCYLRGSFFAGMSSTKLSEGMNNYFWGYFKDTMTLYRFVKQYERVVARRREKEADLELRTFTQLPQLSSQSPLEEHAGKVYTRRVFEIFKKHFNESLSLSAHEELAEGPVRKFKVGPFMVPIEQRCVVEYNSLEEEVHCSCHMFEYMGLVCKHVLKVLQMVDRDTIPSKYILLRWTNEARSGLPVDHIPDNAASTIATRSLCSLSNAVRNVMAMACSSQECCEVSLGTLQGLTEKLTSMVQNATGVGIGGSTIGTQKSTVDSMPEAHKHLKIPYPSVNCGQLSQSHPEHPVEQSIEKRKNRCSICRSTGHNKTKCEAVSKEMGEPGLKMGEPGLKMGLAVDGEPSETGQLFIRF